MVAILEKSAGVPPETVLRLTVDQYHAMIRAGILGEDDPVELLEGWLIVKMPKTPLHSATTRRIRKALERIVPEGWDVDSQEPVTTADSEPEPDVFIMRGDVENYSERHPGPEDLALIVEVSGATLQRDRKLKKPIYAKAAIAVYWLVNLAERRIEVYTEPTGPVERPDYLRQAHYGVQDEVPLVIEDSQVARVAVSELLP